MEAKDLGAVLKAAGVPEKVSGAMRFFKCGKGQYGEGDLFLGVNNPMVRKVAQTFRDLPLAEVQILLEDPFHEIRLCALLIMVEQYRKGNTQTKERVFQTYLAKSAFVNNWDLVDLSAPGISGEHLLRGHDQWLERFVLSGKLWDERIAVLSTLTLIRHGEFEKSLELCSRFLIHRHDLMHKACGWMLREIGKRNRTRLSEFLEMHFKVMPRTMLRYAIEHYPEAERQAWLKK